MAANCFLNCSNSGKLLQNTIKQAKYGSAFSLSLVCSKLRISVNNSFILMFHHVSNEPVNASPACVCGTEHFTNILKRIRKNNIKVVSMDEALDNINKKIFRGYGVISFDDGIDNTFKVAYPLLKEANFPFTIYLTTNYIDRKGYLPYEQLKMLNKDPLCTFGAHTVSHPVLKNAPNARDEIYQSKKLLETILEKRVDHFAYPYGSAKAVSYENIDQVREAGFKSGVSSIGLRLNYFSSLNKFYLPRISVFK